MNQRTHSATGPRANILEEVIRVLEVHHISRKTSRNGPHETISYLLQNEQNIVGHPTSLWILQCSVLKEPVLLVSFF